MRVQAYHASMPAGAGSAPERPQGVPLELAGTSHAADHARVDGHHSARGPT
jgi:hypothetical protein